MKLHIKKIPQMLIIGFLALRQTREKNSKILSTSQVALLTRIPPRFSSAQFQLKWL